MHNYIYIHADKCENVCIFHINIYMQKHIYIYDSENRHTIIHMHKQGTFTGIHAKMQSCIYHRHHLRPSNAQACMDNHLWWFSSCSCPGQAQMLMLLSYPNSAVFLSAVHPVFFGAFLSTLFHALLHAVLSSGICCHSFS